MHRKILFLSTHNLATNPRLVKEIELALVNGFGVTAICFEFDNWSQPLNEKIKQRLVSKINYHGIPGNRKPFLPWFISSLVFSLSKILLNLFPKDVFLLSLKSNKRSWLLLRQLKNNNEKFDLVIAHNPGSFYPALRFARKNEIPFGIDLEDYHPGETNNKREMLHAKNLNKAILPKANYVTAASPLILEYSEADLKIPLKNKEVILNYFIEEEFIEPGNKSSEKLRLVWFSQNINTGRGLEAILPVIKNHEEELELHFFGHSNPDFFERELKGFQNVILHEPLPQAQLHKELSCFDIGLAIEPAKDLNNELALSNKILAYFQAGLYILASDTKAQKEFINEYPEHGIAVPLSFEKLEKALIQLIDQKKFFRDTAKKRFEKAGGSNWENESKKLVEIWRQTWS